MPDDQPEDAPVRRARRVFPKPKHPWLVALGIVVTVLLLLELGVRSIEDQFATLRAGDSAEMILKAEAIHSRSATDRHVGAVFLGNSMMDTAMSPPVFLKSSKTYTSAYNAAIVGAPLATRKRWVEEIVLRDLDPDVIVLGVHPVDLLYSDFLKLNQDPTQADAVFAEVLRETDTSVLGSVDRSLNANVALVRDRGTLRKPQAVWDAAARKLRGQPKPKEFAERTEEQWHEWLKPSDGEVSLYHGEAFRKESVKNMGPKLRENVIPSNYNTTELIELLDALKATGRRIVLVVPPVPVAAWEEAGVDPEVLHQGVKMISDLANQYGFRLIDFTDRGYKTTVFRDMLHTNEYGALQFSRDLALELNG